MDLFVCSSYWEGMPTAVLEAMASGIPIVATDIPGNRGLIQNKMNGILVPPGNPELLQKAISDLLNSQLLRNALVENSLNVVKNYSFDEVVKQHKSLYLNLAK